MITKYWSDVEIKNGLFGMTRDEDVFIISEDKDIKDYIAVYQTGKWDYLDDLFRNKEIKAIEICPEINAFDSFKERYRNQEDCISEVVYTKKCDDGTLKMLKKWRKEIEEEINKREKQ